MRNKVIFAPQHLFGEHMKEEDKGQKRTCKRRPYGPPFTSPLCLPIPFFSLRHFVHLLLCGVFACWLLLARDTPGAYASSLAPRAAWASSMYQLLPPLGSNYSCRFMARASLGGHAVRVRLSN